MKTLQQVLSQSTKQKVEQFAQLWAINVQEEEVPLRSVLVERIRDPIAARFVWEHLSQHERLVLYNVMGQSSRNWMRRDALPKKSQLPESRLEAAITSLKQRLLVFEEQVKMQGNYMYSGWYVAPSGSKIEEVPILYTLSEITSTLYTTGREIFVLPSDRSKMTLDKILTPYHQNDLYRLTMNYRLDSYSYSYTSSRVELRSMIVEELLQHESLSYALEQLDPTPRKLFEWLYEQGGKVGMQEVRKHAGCDDPELYTILQSLADFAIAFDTFSENERVLFIPQEMYENLKRARAQPKPEVAQSGLLALDAPPATIHAGDNFVLYDLAILISAVYQQNIEPTQAGRVPKRLAAKLQPLLHGQPRKTYPGAEDEYMEMLFSNTQKLGLLKLSKSLLPDIKQRYEPGPELEQWSRMNTIEQTKALLQIWVKSYDWFDLYGVHYVPWTNYSWSPLGARSTILKYLQDCVPGRWYAVTSLLQTIWNKDPFALRPMQAGVRSASSRKTSGAYEKWRGCDGEVYIGVLASTLYELGIVTLGYHESDAKKPINPDAFMLTDFGARVLSTNAESAPTVPADPMSNGHRSLVVQPNFELLLLQPDLPTLYSLLPFAQVNQVGIVSRLTLTRPSLLRGLEADMHVEQILRVLEEHSQKEIPQNVEYTLHDWARLYKDVKIAQVVLLEVSSEALADEICASSKLQAFGLRKLGPCAIAARGEVSVQELRRTLDKEGIVVRISGNVVPQQNRPLVIFGMPR